MVRRPFNIVSRLSPLLNIILILLSVSVGYSSWMNRDLSGYGLINIIFAVVKTVAPFIALEYACEVREEKTWGKRQ